MTAADINAARGDKNYARDFKKKWDKVEQFHRVKVHLEYQRKFWNAFRYVNKPKTGKTDKTDL